MKSFEKKDQKLVGTAATNLSFLYYLEGEYKNSEKYAEIAINSDRYNAKALTNLGNCHYQKGIYYIYIYICVYVIKLNICSIHLTAGVYDKAKEYYQEATSVDALCTEAIYNLGLHTFNFLICIYNKNLFGL